MIDGSLEISRKTFLRHVDRDSLRECEEWLCYHKHPKQGLTMAGDYHVRYFRSKLHGERVYGFVHGNIDWVFRLDRQETQPEHVCRPDRNSLTNRVTRFINLKSAENWSACRQAEKDAINPTDN
jgi:hypothetical protein